MITIKQFAFNPFQENTYVLFDQTKECIVVDAGCYDEKEHQQLVNYIESNHLKLVDIVNTHGHFDHVLGIKRLAETYNIVPRMNPNEEYLVGQAIEQGAMFGFKVEPLPTFKYDLTENNTIKFGNSTLHIAHVPGHSKGHVALYETTQRFVLTGDVLFKGSIGRTDLPGGDYDTLMDSIFQKIISLGEEYTVYPGHGPSTTIDEEKLTNPFLLRLGA